MKSVGKVITNELGNEISFVVVDGPGGVTICAVGPTSQVEHTWTRMEINTIREMLNELDKGE